MNVKKELNGIYRTKRLEIESRLKEFKNLWDKPDDKYIFAELIFCILTPQSKAKYCWDAVQKLLKKGLLKKGKYSEIVKELNYVRFKYKKAKFIINARKLFANNRKISIRSMIKQFKNISDTREWLVNNVKGIGLKEASHFLRNIGFGKNLAILDRHILKNMKLYGVIKEIPDSLTKQRYYEIENKIREFSRMVNIPMANLDLLLWCKQTGEVFK